MCYAYETLQFTVIIVRVETGRNNLYFRKTLLLNVDEIDGFWSCLRNSRIFT